MISRAALALTASLVLCGPALAAPAAPYDAKAAPLGALETSLLSGNGYEVRDDGKVWDAIGETPVLRSDMPYLLSRLASAKRLRALLQINNIITRYDSVRHMTPEDTEAVRALVRDNWVVFGITPRNDFRSFFSIEELEGLDKIPPRYDAMSPLTMTDPEPESVTADAPPALPSVTALPPSVTAQPPAVKPPAETPSVSITANPPVVAAPVVVAPAAAAAPAVVVAPAAIVPVAVVPAVAAPVAAAPAAAAAAPLNIIPTLVPMMPLPSLSRPSPFAPAAAPAAAPALAAPAVAAPAPFAVAAVTVAAPAAVVAPAVAPAVVAAPVVAAPPVDPHHSFTAEPAAPPPAIVVLPAPAAPSTSAVVSDTLGSFKAWTPPAASTAAATGQAKPAVAVATVTVPAVAVAPPAPPKPEAPKAVAIGAAEYEAFVAAGPYSKEGKDMLALIGKRAPDFVLPLLRRTVVGAIPQIVFDGTRTGPELRAGFARDAADPNAPPIVALSPGPIYVSIKKGLFGGKVDTLIPESDRAWADLGVARPGLDAMKPGAAPTESLSGDWGPARAYADGSRRGAYSSDEMACELLEQLLLLGLAREGLDASPYAARRWARTGRLMLESRLKDELKQDNFLDPDRRAELRDWLDHPEEADDLLVAAWSGSRESLFDPRRGPPASALDFETRAKSDCVRATLEDDLVDSSRRRARAVGALEHLVDAGVVEGSAAKAAAQAATDAESAARSKLLASPPACPPADPNRAEALRKSILLMAESSRAERLMREHRGGYESHAL